MAYFCKFCGSSIEDDQICNCSQAIQDRTPEQPVAPQAQEPQFQQQVQPDLQVQQQVQQPYQNGQQFQQPQQQAAPTEVHLPEPVAKAVNHLGKFFRDFFKNPLSTADNAETIPVSTSILLLVIQAFMFVFFWAIFLGRTLGTSFEFGVNMGLPFLAMIISWAVLYGAMFIIGIVVNKGSIKAGSLLSVVAMGSFPWSLALVAAGIISLLLGGMFGTVSFISLLLFIATNVVSLMLIERGLRKIIAGDFSRMILLAISAALQFILTFTFLYKSVLDHVMSSFSLFSLF